MTGRRIPRPFEKWLISVLDPLDWVDADEADVPKWVGRIRRRADRVGCTVIYDLRRHWRESVFVVKPESGKRYILAGGAGKEDYCCSALLHELAHATLYARHHHPSTPLHGEKAAWREAARIAQEESLPLVASIRRKALYSHRRAELLRQTAGSKKRSARAPLPKTGKLTSSRRSAPVSVPPDSHPMGKRGRRQTKRDVKHATAKAERRHGKRGLRE